MMVPEIVRRQRELSRRLRNVPLRVLRDQNIVEWLSEASAELDRLTAELAKIGGDRRAEVALRERIRR